MILHRNNNINQIHLDKHKWKKQHPPSTKNMPREFLADFFIPPIDVTSVSWRTIWLHWSYQRYCSVWWWWCLFAQTRQAYHTTSKKYTMENGFETQDNNHLTKWKNVNKTHLTDMEFPGWLLHRHIYSTGARAYHDSYITALTYMSHGGGGVWFNSLTGGGGS